MYKFLILAFSNAFLVSQSITDLNKLRREYNEIIKNQQEVDNTLDLFESENDTQFSPLKEKSLVPYEPNQIEKESKKMNLNHFGYDFFTLRDSISIWENLPTPPNYFLGPGDELIVSLWGETQLRKKYIISRDGKIYDDRVGLLTLSGKTIEDARNYLKSQYSKVYATLSKKNPSTFIDVSIGQIKSINVNFVGKVRYPGVYSVHAFSNLITGLIQAGGIDTTGSLRNIIIKRFNNPDKIIDLYDYFIFGNKPENIQLRDQDIVFVKPRTSYITIDRAVLNPGIYESLKSETVFDLIQFAGGPKYNSSNSVGIESIFISNDGTFSKVIKSYYVNLNETKSIMTNGFDHISVLELLTNTNQVEIIGQVKAPGKYYFNEGMMLSDLLKLSSGFNDTTFWKSVYSKKAEIIRRNPQKRFEEEINVDLNEILNNKLDFELNNLDKVVVHANLNFFEKDNVIITGEVNIPGSYPLLKSNESLQSIINRAGGFTGRSFIEGIEIYRDSLRLAWNNLSVPLSPGDSIVIKEEPKTIRVSGEVYNPGLIEFDESKSLNNYVNLAGGPTKNGDIKDIIIIYPNGEVVPDRSLFSPKILDGSVIIVNKKKRTEPFNPTEIANTALSLISSLVTIAVLSKQL
tara:strand:+ start:5790 stop:7682 length:1893 start_codon:yes stop_codon:yes gene_type:complete